MGLTPRLYTITLCLNKISTKICNPPRHARIFCALLAAQVLAADRDLTASHVDLLLGVALTVYLVGCCLPKVLVEGDGIRVTIMVSAGMIVGGVTLPDLLLDERASMILIGLYGVWIFLISGQFLRNDLANSNC